MRQVSLLQTAILLIGLGSLLSCRQNEDDKQDRVLGRWELQSATSNGEPTNRLDELFFEFYEDGNMRTNLTGATENAVYQINKNKLLQRESELNADYTIEDLTDSTLILSTDLRGFSFRFLLSKRILEE